MPDSAQIGNLISRAMERVGRQGVVTMEESRTAEDHLYVVEGMQFDRGYISPYFVTDPERMVRSPFWSLLQCLLQAPAHTSIISLLTGLECKSDCSWVS